MPEIEEIQRTIEDIARLCSHGLNSTEIAESIDRGEEIVTLLVACIVQLLETTIPKP